MFHKFVTLFKYYQKSELNCHYSSLACMIMINMFVFSKLFLLSLLIFVCSGDEKEDDKVEKIVDGIEKTGQTIQSVKDLVNGDTHSLKDALNLIQSFSALGSVFFPELAVFASALGLINGLIGGGESPDERIIKELTEIKESIHHVETMISNLVPQIREDMIRERFITTIKNPIYNMQTMYNEMIDRRDIFHQNAFRDYCIANFALKTVLSEIYREIVHGGKGEYVELLNGGVSKTVSTQTRYSKIHSFFQLVQLFNFLTMI